MEVVNEAQLFFSHFFFFFSLLPILHSERRETTPFVHSHVTLLFPLFFFLFVCVVAVATTGIYFSRAVLPLLLMHASSFRCKLLTSATSAFFLILFLLFSPTVPPSESNGSFFFLVLFGQQSASCALLFFSLCSLDRGAAGSFLF